MIRPGEVKPHPSRDGPKSANQQEPPHDHRNDERPANVGRQWGGQQDVCDTRTPPEARRPREEKPDDRNVRRVAQLDKIANVLVVV